MMLCSTIVLMHECCEQRADPHEPDWPASTVVRACAGLRLEYSHKYTCVIAAVTSKLQ
jgi:hypothetical protein